MRFILQSNWLRSSVLSINSVKPKLDFSTFASLSARNRVTSSSSNQSWVVWYWNKVFAKE